MELKGRKNAAGEWLRGEVVDRIASAGMIFMVFAGFALGFAIRGLPPFEGGAGTAAAWTFTGAVFLSLVASWLFLRRNGATLVRGLRAERLVGDAIEHALAHPGCAFAHDVKEALGGRGNVDHVVMTPAGVWVVETKSGWLGKRRFRRALGQVAGNVRRVRRHLDTSIPVRGALVIADRWDRSWESDHDCHGETIKALGPKKFWQLLRRERGPTANPSADKAGLERKVWNLGSMRHL